MTHSTADEIMFPSTIGAVSKHKQERLKQEETLLNKEPRMIYDIANEILDSWGNKISPYALPYLEAMLEICKIDEMYGADTGESMVLYFLSNAAGWRGQKAREIKKELKTLLKGAHT